MARGSSAALRAQALLEFGLPAAPRIEELGRLPSGGEPLRLKTPAGPWLLLLSGEEPLQLAFEAALYELLAAARYPAPRPRRTSSDSLIAKLSCEGAWTAAAACFKWPPGEPLDVRSATAPQLLELGRLLARLHQLGETHPAAVPDQVDGPSLAALLPRSEAADALLPVLRAPPSGLPSGAAHGSLSPAHALFLGARCSAVLPSGLASSMPLVLDLAEALAAWALPLPQPVPAMRALVSGYQALRRLAPEERDGLWPSLRHAAARAGARRLLSGASFPLEPLRAADALGPGEVIAAVG